MVMKKIIITIAAIAVVLFSAIYFNRVKVGEWVFELRKRNLPPAASYNSVKKIGFVNGSVETIDIIPVEADLKLPGKIPPSPSFPNGGDSVVSFPKEGEESIPAEFNLDVPFAVQAPFAVWDAVHEDACEEASVIMAAHFVLGKKLPDAAYIDGEILKIVDWETKNFGFWKDTDAEKTAEILRKYYGLKDVRVEYDITLDDIKKEIAAGYPVILPAAGRMLKNPYFKGEGPFYHMVVAKGYTKDGKIITNDPGTKRGKNFAYDAAVLFNAIHDWNGGDVLNGRKAMIVVRN